jgi:hypothetical protein
VVDEHPITIDRLLLLLYHHYLVQENPDLDKGVKLEPLQLTLKAELLVLFEKEKKVEIFRLDFMFLFLSSSPAARLNSSGTKSHDFQRFRHLDYGSSCIVVILSSSSYDGAQFI